MGRRIESVRAGDTHQLARRGLGGMRSHHPREDYRPRYGSDEQGGAQQDRLRVSLHTSRLSSSRSSRVTRGRPRGRSFSLSRRRDISMTRT
jgi:hypothetical protein